MVKTGSETLLAKSIDEGSTLSREVIMSTS